VLSMAVSMDRRTSPARAAPEGRRRDQDGRAGRALAVSVQAALQEGQKSASIDATSRLIRGIPVFAWRPEANSSSRSGVMGTARHSAVRASLTRRLVKSRTGA
jgi:hypothetical protein